ncbi:MAG TPA: hydantoinase/oxoprolinase family protein [Solirubrobacteraceae bacterium]|nr:hydantoinase/oxoprolinase family protein [Solirubrobacteraceae bacterium]
MLLGVDVGGTFTDAVVVARDGRVDSAKVPTTPGREQDGVLAAIDAVLARAGGTAAEVVRFAHGMTVATNALLQMSEARQRPRTALIATEGFTDVVELGRQARASLYRLCERRPAPLAPAELRFGAPERCTPEGVLKPLQDADAHDLIELLAAERVEAVAVVLLHSYAHPQHEQRLGELIARRLPHVHVTLSHELVGTFREYERASTSEIDAALSPLLGDYLAELERSAAARGLPPVQVMQSSGGLADAARAGRHAALTVLSGPAGGVAGVALLGRSSGERNLLCFDMGGTSCDVCLIEDGVVAETAQREIAGRALALPALDIHTVGAGGGSIAWLDPGGALRVGPQSAGAFPGPACYGRGGSEATVTDANLLLGRLPADLPLAGAVKLDLDAARQAVTKLADAAGLEPLGCAEGIVQVAETEMRRALGAMTVQRGIDPRAFALVPFGGAGGLHAVAMAEEIGIARVLCPRAGGVLSALGLAAAAPRRDVSTSAMLAGGRFSADRVRDLVAELHERASAELEVPVAAVEVRHELRYVGQSFELSVRSGSHEPELLRELFAAEHERRYGYRDRHGEIELVNVRLSALGEAPVVRPSGAATQACEREATRVAVGGEWLTAELWRGEPEPGTRIEGCALCALAESTLLIPPGWAGTVDRLGTIVLEQV